MILMQGKGFSKGVANGPIYFFQRPDTTISDTPAADIEAEKKRIAEAQEKSIEQLNALADKARAETGETVRVTVEGGDEEANFAAMQKFFEENF